MVGAAGWLAVGAPALDAMGNKLGVAELAAGTVVTAGAAMLPDLDHPQATVSRSLGSVTQTMSKGFAKLLGGHRNGSHSLLFAGAVGALLAAGLGGSSGPWIALGICFFFSSLVVRTLTEADGLICAAISGIVGAALVTIAPTMDWLFFSVIIGCLLHDLGDVVTPEGVPPLWPLSKARLSIPIIGHTGDLREKLIAGFCGLAAVWLLATMVFVPTWKQNHPVQADAHGSTAHSYPAGGRVVKAVDTHEKDARTAAEKRLDHKLIY